MAETSNPWADLSSLVASAQDAIIGLTFEGVVASWNPAAERLFGYTAAEAVGRPGAALTAGPRSRDRAGLIERLCQGERISPYRDDLRCKDGTIVSVSVAVSPVHAAGEPIGLSEIIRRETIAPAADPELAEIESERADLRRQLLHLGRLGAMGQMATALAHELNQPLTAIATYVAAARRLARSGTVDAEVLIEAMDRAAEQAGRAARIIHHLRSFLSDEFADRRRTSLRETILGVNELIMIAARQAGVRMHLRLDADAPVLIDRVQIQQVLLNLMRNGVEAMAAQERRELHVSTARAQDHIRVTIADTGPGLAPEIAAQLFKPFVTTKPDGMGVGLSICRTIIAAHGGELWLDPDVANGAVFHFRLPLAGEESGET